MFKRLVCPLALASVACVSSAKYESLKQRYDLAQNQLAERQQRVGTLGASVNDAQANVKKLQNEKARAGAEIRLLEAERAQLEHEQKQMSAEIEQLLADRARLRATRVQLSDALTELSRRQIEAERRVAEYRTLLGRFQALIDAGTLKLALSDGRMVLQLPADVLFDSGSSKLSGDGTGAVAQISAVLREVPSRRYQVEGHTDDVPIHNALYRSNWELASARALGVLRAMVDDGIAAQSVSAASYGEHHPTSSNASPEGRRANRRIEIIVVPDLSLLPGYEELQRAIGAPTEPTARKPIATTAP